MWRTYLENPNCLLITVEQAIENICDWIEKKLDSERPDNNHEVSGMVKALAELVSARGEIL